VNVTSAISDHVVPDILQILPILNVHWVAVYK
jgi:hypothetical protein